MRRQVTPTFTLGAIKCLPKYASNSGGLNRSMMPRWRSRSSYKVQSHDWMVLKECTECNIFPWVQDGVLEAAVKIMNRMIELKGLSTDVMKNSSDNANYNREFTDLQQQLFDMGAP